MLIFAKIFCFWNFAILFCELLGTVYIIVVQNVDRTRINGKGGGSGLEKIPGDVSCLCISVSELWCLCVNLLWLPRLSWALRVHGMISFGLCWWQILPISACFQAASCILSASLLQIMGLLLLRDWSLSFPFCWSLYLARNIL